MILKGMERRMKRGEQKTVNGLTAGVKIILGRNAFFRVGPGRSVGTNQSVFAAESGSSFPLTPGVEGENEGG